MKTSIFALLALALSVSCQSSKSAGDSAELGVCPATAAQQAENTASQASQLPPAPLGSGVSGALQSPVHDANGNGIEDGKDIANGTSMDKNANGIPDEAEPK